MKKLYTSIINRIRPTKRDHYGEYVERIKLALAVQKEINNG